MSDEPVDDHVRRTAVERDHVFSRTVTPEERHVGDSTEILYGTRPIIETREEDIVEERAQRSALASERDVARAEVADDEAPGPLRNDRELADLHVPVPRFALVAGDGMNEVRRLDADSGQPVRVDRTSLHDRKRSERKFLAELQVCDHQLVGAEGIRDLKSEERSSDLWLDRIVDMGTDRQ